MKILIVGGDQRMKIAFEELKNQGYAVDSLGLFDNDNGNIKECDIVLLPVPTTRDGVNVFCPQSDKYSARRRKRKAAHSPAIGSRKYTSPALRAIPQSRIPRGKPFRADISKYVKALHPCS